MNGITREIRIKVKIKKKTKFMVEYEHLFQNIEIFNLFREIARHT